MGRSIILVVACLALSSCGMLPSNPFARATPQGALPYRANLSPVTRGAPDFAVSVNAPGVPLAAFRESARFPGTRYCLRRFGSSEIDWTLSPATGDWAVGQGADGRPVLTGRCRGR